VSEEIPTAVQEPRLIEPSIMQLFEAMEDPRRAHGRAYPLQEMLLVALCAISSDADDWVHVAEWGELKLPWLRRYLPFTSGVASHDTFSRLFALLDAEQFAQCFTSWMAQLCPTIAGQSIAIDGKSVRGSHDAGSGMAHLVSAWHSGAGVTLGQVKTATKSNEITAIPELLAKLDIAGATITLDAMGCQREIVQDIVQRQSDYIIAVKNNQPNLAQAIEGLFDAAQAGGESLTQELRVEKGHGRLHSRRCVVQTDLTALGQEMRQAWPGLKSAVMIESVREVIQGRDKSESSTEWRYYISSLALDAGQFSEQIQAHWKIENSCHWVLDVVFDEDASRVRRDHGAENMALLRRMSLNLIKQDKTKGSIKVKRKRAAWSSDYLEHLLALRPLDDPHALTPA
jgi:predicted transposase YbfD/YdcC